MVEPCDDQHQVKYAPAKGAESLWAGLEDLSEDDLEGKTIGDVMTMQDEAAQGRGRNLYLHDASIDRCLVALHGTGRGLSRLVG